MGIYLDSAKLSEITDAKNYPFLAGITTNPALIAKALGRNRITGDELIAHISEIRKLVEGEVFVQTNFQDAAGMIKEAKKIHEALGDQGIIKVPVTLPGIQAIDALTREGIRCAGTAVFTGVQAYIAMSAGAEFVIPYYSRIDRTMQDGLDVIEDILEIIDNNMFDCNLLVASVKTPFDVLELLRVGVDGITIPIELIGELLVNFNTQEAAKIFREALEVSY